MNVQTVLKNTLEH